MSNTEKDKKINIVKPLEALMASKKLSQQKVAEETGVAQPTVAGWLKGAMPNAVNLNNLAHANGVSVSFFLEINPEPERREKKEKGIKNESKSSAENQLTKQANALTNESVQPVLPKLIERLKRATQERGMKVALAKSLGVHRQSVTDWLSGKQEPGGEITLRLLQWVEQQERQK